jgi:hypothetical protein
MASGVSAAAAVAAVEASDVTTARQCTTATLRELGTIGDVVADFTKEFRGIWEALVASHTEEEGYVDQVKALLLEVDQHRAAIGDSLVCNTSHAL